MIEKTLLIDNPFALKQLDGKPVHIETAQFKRITNKDEIRKLFLDLKNYKKNKNKSGQLKRLVLLKNKDAESTKDTIHRPINKPVDVSNIKRIIISTKGKGFITMDFIDFAKSLNIPIYWLNKEGMIDAFFMPIYFKKPSLILEQCKAKSNGKDIEIAKYLIGLKLKTHGMSHLIRSLDKVKTIKEVIAIEGTTANKYYSEWVFNKYWNWKGRGGKNTANKLATDPINCMLNLGYSLLAQQMSEILIKRGFELSIGFMHVNERRKYWNMLSYDFIEPYRVLIDQAVLEIVNNSLLTPDDFTFTDDKKHLIHRDRAFKLSYQWYINALDGLEHKALPTIRTVESML